MSPLEARLPKDVSLKAGRRLVLRRAARAVIGPLAIAVGLAVATPTVINLLGGKAEGVLGAVVAFMGGANFVQEGLDIASAALFVLAGVKLLGRRPHGAREEFAAGLVALSSLWVSLLRSTLYRSLLPWSFRFAVLVALLSLLAAAFVLFRLFGEDGATTIRLISRGAAVRCPALPLEPSMSDYDVVIIGGGPAGYNAAIRAGQLGLKVACVEKRVSLGGTCLNVGCIPSKALLNASHMFDEARTGFASLGIKVDPILDLPQMLKQKDESVTALTKGVEYLFKKNKVDWLKGQGRIDGPGRVIVRASSGEETVVLAKNIVIATGSEPTVIPGVVVDQEKIVDSTGALSLAKVPKKMIVIGAGVIGLELGSVWRRLGAEVEVVEFLDRIMPTADTELAAGFQKIMARQGIKFRLSTKVVSATTSPDGVALAVESVAGGAGETLQADVVLVAVGRRPYTEGLGLETVGLAVDRRGVLINEHFASGAPGVFVIGDVTQGPMLAHKGEDEAIACIERIAGGAGHVNPDIIPSVVYTHPEAAWVGKTEEELKAAGVAYKAGRFPFTANARARVNHEREGFVKILADAVTDRILGVHMIGPEVGEMIGEYCLAMEFGGASEDVARTSHPHPTRSEAGRQAAMGVEGWTMQA